MRCVEWLQLAAVLNLQRRFDCGLLSALDKSALLTDCLTSNEQDRKIPQQS